MTLIAVGAVALAAGIGIGAVAWMGGDHADSTMTGMSSGAMAEPAAMDHSASMDSMAGALSEQAFLEQMVPHHESAVAMAQLALAKSQRSEVRSLARDIVSSQEDEIAQMKAWHKEWFGTALAPDTSAMHSMDMSALETATGDDFDKAFLAMMIPHHASAIVMADSVTMGAPRQEVTELAAKIISAQAKEIGRMQTWRERWYPPLG